jgi:hypothetical protein
MTKEEFKLLNFIDVPIKEYEFNKMRYIGMGHENSLEVCFDTTGKQSMFCYNGSEGSCSIEPRGTGKAVLQWKCKLDWFYGGINSGKSEIEEKLYKDIENLLLRK